MTPTQSDTQDYTITVTSGASGYTWTERLYGATDYLNRLAWFARRPERYTVLYHGADLAPDDEEYTDGCARGSETNPEHLSRDH